MKNQVVKNNLFVCVFFVMIYECCFQKKDTLVNIKRYLIDV